MQKPQKTVCLVEVLMVVDVTLTGRLKQVNVVATSVQQLTQHISVRVDKHLPTTVTTTNQ